MLQFERFVTITQYCNAFDHRFKKEETKCGRFDADGALLNLWNLCITVPFQNGRPYNVVKVATITDTLIVIIP